jgi:spore coat protein A, manganese oxidase
MHLRKLTASALLAAGVLFAPTQATAAPLGPVAKPAPMPVGGYALIDPKTQPKFKYELPVPIFYTPDQNTFPGFDFYRIEVAPVEQLGVAFPQPPGGAASVPAGYQWLGLVNPTTGQPLFTPLWGYSQLNGGLISAVAGHPVATYPSMSFRATKGRPVKVEWVNNAPDWHVLCPYPADPTQPCAIDRTIMGTQDIFDTTGTIKLGQQQPDNAIVIHLHGGEIPPDSDGFAELWVGNPNTMNPSLPALTALAAGIQTNLDPPFLLPPNHGIPADADYATQVLGFDLTSPAPAAAGNYQLGALRRPIGNSIFYNYPMVQDAATIWYHDHALGKTRVNVVAGPAGYFWIDDPAREATIGLPNTGDCSNAGILSGYCYDIPLVFQDRAFNDNGTINFPNGLGVTGIGLTPGTAVGADGVTLIHPQWVPEYFGDHAVVNGALWPKLKVEPRPYRFRFLDGSNARCYTFGLKVPGSVTAPAFYPIGSDQGYVPAPLSRMQKFTMCPGERYDVVIDFSQFAGKQVYVTNTAGAPFPAGPTPQDPLLLGGFPELATLMRFDVQKPLISAPPASYALGLPGAPSGNFARAWNPAAWNNTIAPLPTSGIDPVTGQPIVVRQKVLNEVLDVNGTPQRVQIDGKAFEDLVTETPARGSVEVWKIVNTTVDAHPMHLHLVQFQVVSRQPFNVDAYKAAVGLPAGVNTTGVDVANFVYGAPRGPDANETGWKDTAKSYPGEVLTLVARWDGRWADCPAGTAQVPGSGVPVCNPAGTVPSTAPQAYFAPVTAGPYVWHCHIVDHEDNEMMRPSLVLPTRL